MGLRQPLYFGAPKPLTKNGPKRAGAATLKKKFLRCFDIRTSNTETLRDIVRQLIVQGVVRKTLVTWAIQAGYAKSGAASVLSRIFCSHGLRERRAGAGRKPSPEALELTAYARRRFGENSFKVLRAAWWAEKRERVAQGSGGRTKLIDGQQLATIDEQQLGRDGTTHGNVQIASTIINLRSLQSQTKLCREQL